MGWSGRSEALSGAALGGGTDFGRAVQVSGDTGAVREAGIQLLGPAATGLCAALVSPAMAIAVLR